MFPTQKIFPQSSTSSEEVVLPVQEKNTVLNSSKYKSVVSNIVYADREESSFSAIDVLLENEKQQNKKDAWNKIDKTVKIQKLHEFAEKYGKDNSFPLKDIKGLKTFFSESLDKGKLQKTKDVIYDKDKGIINSIPALFFNSTNRLFTLKNMDIKRVSTLKSLTPKKIPNKEKDD